MMKLWERHYDAPQVTGACRSRAHPYLVLCHGAAGQDAEAAEVDAGGADETTTDRDEAVAAAGASGDMSCSLDDHHGTQTAVVYQWVRLRH